MGTRLADLRAGRRRVAGLGVVIRYHKGRRGRLAVMTLDDGTARVEVTVYNDVLEVALDKLVEDRIVIVEGECKVDEMSSEHTVNAQKLWSMGELRQQLARGLLLQLDASTCGTVLPFLRTALGDYAPGECVVSIQYERAGARARLKLADDWRVKVSDQLLEQLQSRLGEDAVLIEY